MKSGGVRGKGEDDCKDEGESVVGRERTGRVEYGLV